MTALPVDERPSPFARGGLSFFSGNPVRLLLPAIAGLLVLVQWFSPNHAKLFDLICIIALGLPHGALDVEVARSRLIGRVPHLWFLIFALPYLMLALAVLALWRVSPVVTLCLFLAMSVWHFGDKAGASILSRLLRGGAPVALPVLFHPALTAGLLGGIMQVQLQACPAWLVAGSIGWLALAAIAFVFRMEPAATMLELAWLALLYAVMPPLTALAIYFVCLHAPAHMSDVIGRRLSNRVVDTLSAWRHAALPTLMTLGLGVMLWPFYQGSPVDRLLALTIQGLAALTLPHMLMGKALYRAGGNAQKQARVSSAG